ncbi:MAG TPA: type II toxin-antitoxin system HicA family toxin [Terriglobia bacterium]|nr:type II toxin-antitoxin system HicA family toxin [Terriglobia bacterium]
MQVRQKGSHRFFRHQDGRTATVPDHRDERPWSRHFGQDTWRCRSETF